jgi:hypothetical protein
MTPKRSQLFSGAKGCASFLIAIAEESHESLRSFRDLRRAFLIIAAAIKLFMKRHAIDLSDVQETAGLSLSADFCSERGG